MCPHRVKNWLLIWYMPVTIWPRECRKTDDIFSFFGWCLFPPSSRSLCVLSPSHSIAIPTFSFPSRFRITLSASPLCNSSPSFPPFSNVLLESDSIFAPAVLLWRGHISWPYPREARTRDAKAAKEKGGRAGWQTGITGENTGAFNMQLPSTLPEGKTSRKIGANTRASSGSRPDNSESRLTVTSGPRARRRDQFSRFLKFCNKMYLKKR